ncbi:hypothetical protein Pmani_004522 [Petrolisthes manimaculis]|uniref:Uncharacterized protein n=1 Tax=Petrolisthes manimaculis TaxID=1843537 RepID=A0AAE1UIF8_9EUCA|nr:hypothetical protein Pmani_004522 [Petrolisthes manimaculis]
MPEVFPVCAVTRAMARMEITESDEEMQEDQDLGVLFAEPGEIENKQRNGKVGKVENQVELKVDMEIEKYYELNINHVQGSENVIADALSRAPTSREAS